jgi:hypothetical protein
MAKRRVNEFLSCAALALPQRLKRGDDRLERIDIRLLRKFDCLVTHLLLGDLALRLQLLDEAKRDRETVSRKPFRYRCPESRNDLLSERCATLCKSFCYVTLEASVPKLDLVDYESRPFASRLLAGSLQVANDLVSEFLYDLAEIVLGDDAIEHLVVPGSIRLVLLPQATSIDKYFSVSSYEEIDDFRVGGSVSLGRL